MLKEVSYVHDLFPPLALEGGSLAKCCLTQFFDLISYKIARFSRYDEYTSSPREYGEKEPFLGIGVRSNRGHQFSFGASGEEKLHITI